MIKQIISAIVLAIAAFLAYVFVQPSEYTISREVIITADPYVIFPFINNPRKMDEWMPWKEMDPKVEPVYSGAHEGVDAKSSWNSEGQMGTGEALIIESHPPAMVKTQLTYTKPMEMSQVSVMTIAPTAQGTLVKWTVMGNNDFPMRVMCILMNMDKQVGSQFEKGLAKLKKITEEIR